MITLFNDKKDCCGCTACVSSCPKQTITMKPDEDGFLYPIIEHSSCTECTLCNKVCAFQKDIKNKVEKTPLATYAAVLKNADLLKNSASGGVFVALALYVLENNGVIFGCAMNDEFEAEHICIDDIKDLKKLQGSKYVQSNLKETLFETKRNLKDGRQVLYVGTPCQISGLKSYLGKDYDNLITIDIICHGVPSPKFFKGYITWLNNKLKGNVTNFRFRDKRKGWGHAGYVKYKKADKTFGKHVQPITSYYYQYFLRGDISRNSCYECPYAGSNRQGDFTIGDYWGIFKIHPEIKHKKGVSVLLVNSKKANDFLSVQKNNNDNTIGSFLDLHESTFEKARAYNRQLNYPVPKSENREKILKLFREEGFQAVADEYYSKMKKAIFIAKIKFLIPYDTKVMIKKIVKKIKPQKNH